MVAEAKASVGGKPSSRIAGLVVALAETLTGITLKTIDYTERSRIATYFSRELGRLDVLLPQAKGAKAKHAGASELGGIFTLHVKPPKTGATLYRLEQYEVHTSLVFSQGLEYEALQALMPCLELMKLLTLSFSGDAEKRQRLFAQYEALLCLWKEAPDDTFIKWSMLWFWQGVLGLSGQIPPWGWDVVQQDGLCLTESNRLYYLPQEGGLTQSSTALSLNAWQVSRGTWKALCVLEALQSEAFKTFLEVPVPPVNTLFKLEAFYQAVLKSHGIALQSLSSTP